MWEALRIGTLAGACTPELQCAAVQWCSVPRMSTLVATHVLVTQHVHEFVLARMSCGDLSY